MIISLISSSCKEMINYKSELIKAATNPEVNTAVTLVVLLHQLLLRINDQAHTFQSSSGYQLHLLLLCELNLRLLQRND